MYQETNESKSPDVDRLRPSNGGETTLPTMATPQASKVTAPRSTGSSGHVHHSADATPLGKTSYSINKQQMAATALHQHYLNYFNSNIPKEESKSQRTCGSISSQSLSQHSKVNPSNYQDYTSSHLMNQSFVTQRTNHNTNRVASNNSTYVYQIPSQIHNHPNNHQQNPINISRSVPRDESPLNQRLQQHLYQQQQQQQLQPTTSQTQNPQIKSRTHSTGAQYPIPQYQQSQMSNKTAIVARTVNLHELHQQQQQERDSEEMAATTTTTIKEELENDLQGCKTSELEAISSLERNLPIELSFLIRQQAHCMARMNYLDRQIREMKDAAQAQQQVDANQVSSTSIIHQGHLQRPTSNVINSGAMMTHTKNGNFILSDDSGGEYSRATISDDDELSSLLDQIAKTVRPERGTGNSMIGSNYSHLQQQQQQQQQRLVANCGTLINSTHQQPHPQQSYAILNSNQLHQQQAVPIFVMGSPIAVAHPSSINSNILPGVHFQPEPRYNQYYEDFYYHNTGNVINANGVASSMVTTPTPAMHRHHNYQQSHRSQQFDNSISVIEQLVSQKEKRQIMSQLKSADNWLKMRSSNQDGAPIRNVNKQQQQQPQLSTTQQGSAGSESQDTDTQSSETKTTNATPSSSTMQAEGDRILVGQAQNS